MNPSLKSVDCAAALALAAVGGGLAVGSMIWMPRTPHAARVAKEGGTVFLPATVMHRGYALTDGLVRACARAGLAPDVISWAALVLGAAAGAAFGAGLPGIAAWLLAISGLGDMLDGAVARSKGPMSHRGAVLDSVLDRYVEYFVFAGLVCWFSGHVEEQLLAVTALFGGTMVTYSTAKAEALGLEPPRGWMKRPERIAWLLLGAIGASIGGGIGGPSGEIMTAAVSVIAVFANLSAFRRLRALARSADETLSPQPKA